MNGCFAKAGGGDGGSERRGGGCEKIGRGTKGATPFFATFSREKKFEKILSKIFAKVLSKRNFQKNLFRKNIRKKNSRNFASLRLTNAHLPPRSY